MSITITPINGDIGATITGITGSEAATPEVASRVQEAIDRYGVVVLPSCTSTTTISPRSPGCSVRWCLPPHGALADHPEIAPVTRDPEQDKMAQYREANVQLAHRRDDERCAGQADDADGDPHGGGGGRQHRIRHHVCRVRALPDEEKERIDGLRVRHSFASAQRKIEPDPTEKQLAQWASVPSREHPLVWKRKDGRRSLVMGSTAEAVLDMPDDEGQAILQRLIEWATQPQFTLSHSWHEGDLVIFDNTGLLHRAMPYAATSQRLMHRATVAGEEAFA